MKNLEDASEELILYDETDGSTIPFLQGEAFMCLNLKDTNVSTFIYDYQSCF